MFEQTMNQPIDLDQIHRHSLSDDMLNLENLIRACYPTVYHLALSILNDPHDAEDAAQEALMSAITSLDRYRGDSSFKTWLYTITVNTCRGMLRKHRTREKIAAAMQKFVPLTASPPTPDEAASRSDSERRLWAAVDTLDDKHRLPIILRYVYNLPANEIATTLGINEGTVYSRLHYAREKLQEILTQAETPRSVQEEI